MAYYENIIFDGNDITAITNVKINNMVLDTMPNVVMSKGKLSRKDGAKVYNKEYGEKKIAIEGVITATDRQGYLDARTELLSKLDGVEKTLAVTIGHLPLEYTATVQNVTMTDSTGGYGLFVIDLISSGFGRDRDAREIIVDEAISASPTDQAYNEAIGGSVNAPLLINLTVTAVTGGTDSYIQLSNEQAQSIKVIRTWAVDDILEIDTELKTCTVNGVATDYTGYFFQVGVGESELTYTDDFTTRGVNLRVTYKRRYL